MKIMKKCIEISGLGKTYYGKDGNKTIICKNLNLTIERGKIYSIIGNSGCGKSTLINMIGGFEKYEEGKIIYDQLNGERVGIVFQDNVLFPWKTIMGNMLLACKGMYSDPEKVIVEELDKIGLKNIANSYPNELSGGMQQRVALLRVLLTKPSIVILDEAFGALDYKTRVQMQDYFMKCHREYGFTAIIVTHDLLEACKLGDVIWTLRNRPIECKEIEVKGEDVSQDFIGRIAECL